MSNQLADSRQTVTHRGSRNYVLVLPSVICSHTVADRIADTVDGCVATPHDHGCAQIGRDNERTKRTLIAMGTNPNVAGVVVVGLGCEHVQSDTVATALKNQSVPVRELTIQGVGGTEACLTQGIEAAVELRKSASNIGPTRIGLGDLTVGIISTDVSEPTATVADPLVGAVADRVQAAGGRVVVAGTERVTAHPEAASNRVDDPIDSLVEAARSEPPHAPAVHRQIAASSFDAATRAWGGNRIDELIEYGDSPDSETSLGLVDSASRFEEAATALVAAGAQVIVHVTGDGIPTGHPIAPVIKVSATPRTLKAVPADIDIDARSTDVEALVEYLESIANGAPCRAEVHGVTGFAIKRVGPSM